MGIADTTTPPPDGVRRPLPGAAGRAAGPTVAGLLDTYAGGLATPTQVVDDVLSRIADHDDPCIWVDRVPAPALRAAARHLEELVAADPVAAARLPLLGVPFAVKGNIDVAGLPTTAACPAFAYEPAASAEAVRRLVDAGALLVGTTNLDQFATGLVGVRSPYGVPRNVFGGGLVPGGSSSGSAVAVAAGLVAFSLGTDTAGSGRVPAALNGIVGLKPTRGLVSVRGVVPACRSLDCVSVFSHTADDARRVLDVLAGPDPQDPWSRCAAAPTAGAAGPPGAGADAGSLRLGLPPVAELDFFGDDAMQRAHLQARVAVAAACASVRGVPFGPLREAGSLLYEGPWIAERLADLGGFLATHPDDVLPVTRAVISDGAAWTAAESFAAQHRLTRLRHEVHRWWDDVDVVLLPTVGTTFTVDEVTAEPLRHNATLGHYTQGTNLLDLAAVAVPVGLTDDGRPVGVTLVGPAFSEDRLLTLAARVLGEAAGARPPTIVAPAVPATGTTSATTTVAVAGRHLSGESRNGELVGLGGRLLETTRTAARYRLLALPPAADPLPVLVRTADGGGSVEVELWAVPDAAVAALLAAVPAPLALGRLALADGREVTGFVGTPWHYDADDVVDLTATGSWRNRPGTPSSAPAPHDEEDP